MSSPADCQNKVQCEKDEVGIYEFSFTTTRISSMDNTNEPRREKTGLRGFRPGPTQTGLYKLRKELEA